MREKRFLHFRSRWLWPLTFRPQICSSSYYYQALCSIKLEVSTAFLFRKNREARNRRTDGRGATVNAALGRAGYIVV